MFSINIGIKNINNMMLVLTELTIWEISFFQKAKGKEFDGLEKI